MGVADKRNPPREGGYYEKREEAAAMVLLEGRGQDKGGWELENEEELVRKWTKLVGPKYEVKVSKSYLLVIGMATYLLQKKTSSGVLGSSQYPDPLKYLPRPPSPIPQCPPYNILKYNYFPSLPPSLPPPHCNQVDLITKDHRDQGLGINIKTVKQSGETQWIRHTIAQIRPDSLINEHQIIREGDEILQINEHVLVGLQQAEVVEVIFDTPSLVRVVVCREVTVVIVGSHEVEEYDRKRTEPIGEEGCGYVCMHPLVQKLMVTVWPHEVEPWVHSWYRGRVETLDAKYDPAYINSTLYANSSYLVNFLFTS